MMDHDEGQYLETITVIVVCATDGLALMGQGNPDGVEKLLVMPLRVAALTPPLRMTRLQHDVMRIANQCGGLVGLMVMNVDLVIMEQHIQDMRENLTIIFAELNRLQIQFGCGSRP